jgi:hypothetical protein
MELVGTWVARGVVLIQKGLRQGMLAEAAVCRTRPVSAAACWGRGAEPPEYSGVGGGGGADDPYSDMLICGGNGGSAAVHCSQSGPRQLTAEVDRFNCGHRAPFPQSLNSTCVREK